MQRLLTTILAAAFLTLTGCTEMKREDLFNKYTDGAQLIVNTDVLRNVLTIQAINANPIAEMPIPQGLQIEVSGPSRAEVFSMDGKSSLAPFDGLMEIGIDKTRPISSSNPVDLTFSATAPGFLPATYRFIVTDTFFSMPTLHLIALDDLPAGVDFVEGTVPVEPELGVFSPITYTTPLFSDKPESATLTFQGGTLVYDENGQPLTGDLQLEYLHFGNREAATVAAFPGGTFAAAALAADGSPMGPVNFAPAGWFNISLKAGARHAKSFSEPVEATMELNPNTINPNTGEPIRAGDQIPIWSRDEGSAAWSMEGLATITSFGEGPLSITFGISHLSDWAAAFSLGESCSTGAPIVVNFETPYPTLLDAPYSIIQFVDQISGQVVARPQWARMVDGTKAVVYGLPANRVLTAQVVTSFNPLCSEVLYTSAPFLSVCNGSALVSTRAYTQPNTLTVEARFSAVCPSAGDEVLIRPEALVYYKETGCPHLTLLTYINRGRFLTDRLVRNQTYDFTVYFNGERYEFSDITVATTELDIDDYTLRIDLDGDFASFIFENVKLDPEFCGLLLGE